MTSVILYTIHASSCFVLALVLWLCAPRRSELLSHYTTYLHKLAVCLMVSVPADVIILAASLKGMVDAVWALFLPLFNVLQIALVVGMFHTVLHTPADLRRWPRILLAVFGVVCMVYPLVFAQCRLYYSIPFNIEGLLQFSRMPVSVAMGYFVYAIAAVFMLLCLWEAVRLSRVFLQVYRAFGRKFNSFPVTLLVLLIMLVITSFMVQGVEGMLYHWGLMLWLIFDIWLAVYSLNHREDFLRVERDALFVQIEMELASLNKEASSPEEKRVRRERAVVMRALNDWAARPDKPYLRQDLSLIDVAEEIGMPPSVLSLYGIESYGLKFEEYIAYLREKNESSR